ncbi:MAG: chitobiase/beta-hexosaminidase C-terminal domain-containing protein [Planctomycetes bacterium]|nr:chitobiase/beta-hexosaminidase C-terminal domain-containing protein [Planctomycetota bacterium]
MKLNSLISRWGITVASASAILPLIVLSGCSSSSNDSAPAAGDFGVVATPASGSFTTPTLEVSLEAVGKTLPNPVIHYTTDLSEPTAVSPVYTVPFTISVTTVVKAKAINTDMTESPVMVKGYVFSDSRYRAEWAASGHGNIAAEPFRHWDDDGQVSTSCARCHGANALRDYADNGVVDSAAALALGHDCNTCHSPIPLTLHDDLANYPALEDVEFPSMQTASLYSSSNLCMACHQGRESGVSIDDDIAADPVGPYRFVNIHYYAAAATMFGGETNGGYEYSGKEYVGRNAFPSHEADQASCVGCHLRGDLKDHRLMPEVSDCTGCHAGDSFETLGGTPAANYVGIQTLKDQLMATIQFYATNTLGFDIAYDAHSYPYFVNDTNGNGVADDNELGSGNRYEEFDAALLKAAYNFQVASKDPAGYIHNGVYIRQLLHDSIEDLGVMPAAPAPGRTGFNLAAATKSEQWHVSGHGISTSEPFRHWDGDGEVSTSCARCHTSTGFADYLNGGVVDDPAPLGETIECSACHNSPNLFADHTTRYDDLVTNDALSPVTFPSGDTGTMGDSSNLCISCHQGRASGLDIDAASPNTTVQAPADYDSFSFINRHYFAAGAILFGADVSASYEYAGRTYEGKNTYAGHAGDNDTCMECHMRGTADHSFRPRVEDCTQCHLGITNFEELGLPNGMVNVDYDGSGLGESFEAELEGMRTMLYAAIQNYADMTLPQSSKIVYGPGSYPYWFKDTNGDGLLTPGEDSFANGYKDFDRELLRAAYNFHSAQDPCSDMHNYKYVLQSLYDSVDMLDDGALNNSPAATRP